MTDLLSAASDRSDDWVRLIGTIVDIDSGPDDRAGISSVYDVLGERLGRLGFEVERVETSGPHVLRGRRASAAPGAPRIGLIGHADTVFERGTPQERPFAIDGDRMTGPGVADMKAGLAVALGSLELLGEQTLDALDLTVVVNGDEESGSADSRDVIVDLAQHLDVALVFEAGRAPDSIVKSRRGAHRFDVIVRGLAAHTGVDPDAGANAIEAMAHHILAIQNLGRSTAGATVNAVMISGGSRPNIVPDHAVLRVDSRFDTEEAETVVIEGMQRLAGDGPVSGTSTEIVSLDRRPAFTATADSLADRYVTGAARLGLAIDVVGTGGSSDGNFTSAAGVPTLDGLGAVGGGYHTSGEFALISSVHGRAAATAALLRSIAEEGS